MRIPASKLKSIRRQGITILVLLLGLGTYLAGFLPMQRAFLVQRYFRVLADMGNQVNEAVSNLATSALNAARTPGHAALPEAGGSVLLEAMARGRAESGTPSTAPVKPDAAAELSRIQNALRLVPNLDLLQVTAETRSVTNGAGAGAALGVEVKGSGKASWLELTCTTDDSRLRARSDLQRLLAPIVDRGEFDDVLLLDAKDTNGVVLYQLSSGSLQVLRLAVPVDRSFQTNLVNYAGAEYRMFSQPVQFVPPGTGNQTNPPTPWILCGLIRADRFAQETRSVSYTVLVVFSFLAVLLLASWPFLNVWSVGLKGGLSLREIFLLCVSTVAMNGFLTLLVLDLFARDRLQNTSDNQLESLATSIETNLRSELRQIAAQLGELSDRFPSHPSNQVSVLKAPHLVDVSRTPYPYFGMAGWIDRESGRQLAKWTVKANLTPMITVGHREYFRAIADSRPWLLPASDAPDSPMIEFCLEPIFSANTGEFLATFSMRPRPMGTNDWRIVATLDCQLLSLINSVLPTGFGFCVVDPQGKVAFHSDERRSLRENFFEECEQNHRLLAAVAGRQTARLHARYTGNDHALHIRPLPGTPWCLVTFRDKIVAGTTLVEAVSVGVLLLIGYCCLFSATVGLVYATGIRRYMAWLWPTDKRAEVYGLLVLLNLAFAATLALITFLPTDGLPGCIAALVIPPIAMVTCLRALSRGHLGSARLRHLARRSPLRLPYRYGYVLAIGTLLLVVGTLPIIAFFRAAFVVETRLMVKRAQLQLAQDFEGRAQRLWAEVHGSGIAGPHRESPRLIAPPPLALPATAPGESARAASFRGRAGFLSRRLTNTLDIYTDFFFDTQVRWSTNAASPALPAPAQPWLERWLLPLRPHYNQKDILTRSVAGNGAADRAWTWVDRVVPTTDTAPQARLELIRSTVHIPARTEVFQLTVDSATPDWGGFPWLWLLVFIPLFSAPYLVVYILADRVLLLHVSPPLGANRAVLDPDGIDSQAPFGRGKYLLLGPPRSGKSQQLVPDRFTCLKPESFDRIDLREPTDQLWLAPDKTEELLRRTDRALVIDSFEHRHDDPEFNRKKLQFLHQVVVDEPRTVILVSNIHPLHFTLGAEVPGKPTPESESVVTAASWVDVLTGFRRLFMVASGGLSANAPSEGHTSIDARAQYRSLWRTCSPAEQEVLFDVANGRLISSYQPELAVLLERGLLRRDPALHLANPSFRRFVLATYRPGSVVRGAVEDIPGFWDSLKGPVVTVLIILAGFFFITQKEMWNNTVGLTTTFLAGIGAFAKASEMFQKARMNQPPPG